MYSFRQPIPRNFSSMDRPYTRWRKLMMRVRKAASPKGEAPASSSTPRYCPLPA